MKVLSYVKGMDGCSYHRVYLPNQSINADVRVVSTLDEESLAWCDILHYSRHSVLAPEFLDKQRRKHGFKIVVDTDDWWQTGKDHPNYEYWLKSNISLQVRHHLINADAIICTHERLAARAASFGDHIYVIPNMIDYGHGQFSIRKSSPSTPIRLLYANSTMNYANLQLIKGLAGRIKDLNITMVIAGACDTKEFTETLKIFEGLNIETHPWTDVESYMSVYNADVLLLPCRETEFNSMKSNIKILEAACKGMAVIASDCTLYRGFPDVWYASSLNDWERKIREIVEDPGKILATANSLQEYCIDKCNLSTNAYKREMIYEEIIQRSNSNSR